MVGELVADLKPSGKSTVVFTPVRVPDATDEAYDEYLLGEADWDEVGEREGEDMLMPLGCSVA